MRAGGARTPAPSSTAAAPTQNGTCTLTCSPSTPASHGAIAAPENRTKLYAAEATPRSTGAAFITVSVISVLLIPMNRPATTTHVASTALFSVPSGHHHQRRGHRQEVHQQGRHGAEPALQPRRDHHGGERQREAPAEEDQPDLMGAHVERERRERQQGEEAEVVEQRGDCDTEQAAVPQRPERVGQRGRAFGARRGRQQERGDDERRPPSTPTPRRTGRATRSTRAHRRPAGRRRCQAPARPRTG